MKVVIGSRGSALALWQANWARRKLARAYPDLSIEIEVIKTEGDRLSETPVSQIGGKEVWTKEIEHALLSGNIDLAVHSLKDLPTRLPEGLVLGAISPREDVRDVLVSKNNRVFRDLPEGARIATGSSLGIEIREGDERITDLIGVLNCVETQQAVTAERAMLAALGGDCSVPIGGYAVSDKVLILSGIVATPDGRQVISEKAEGQASYAEALGERVAKGLLEQGAGEILGTRTEDT